MRSRCRRRGFEGYGEDESYYELVAGRLYQNVNLTFRLYQQEFGRVWECFELFALVSSKGKKLVNGA